MAPLFYASIGNGARMMQHQPMLKVFQERQKEAAAEKRQDLMLSLNKERREYMKRHDIKLSRMFMPILVQAPLFITFVVTLRRFATEHDMVPGFSDGGVAWFPHLHQPDPLYVLPLVTALFTVGAVRINNSIRSNQWFTRDQMRRGMMGLSAAFLPIAAFLPSVMTLYFAITSVTVFLQQASLHSAGVRRWLQYVPCSAGFFACVFGRRCGRDLVVVFFCVFLVVSLFLLPIPDCRRSGRPSEHPHRWLGRTRWPSSWVRRGK